GSIAVPHPGRSIPVLRGSLHHSFGCSAGNRRRNSDPLALRHYAECHVAGGHRGVEQHFDRGVHATPAQRGHGGPRSSRHGVPGPVAPGAHDLACDHHRIAAHGAQTRRRQRGLCAAGACHPGRAERFGGADRIPRPGGLRSGLRRARSGLRAVPAAKVSLIMRNSILIFGALAVCGSPQFAMAQPPAHLTLAQAQQLAIQNNPQFTAARYNAAAAYQTAPQYKAAYEPTVFGSLTGVGADNGSRLAAGGLNNPIVYNRIGTGLSIGQMVTDFGRTSNLIAMAKLQASAQDQVTETTRAEI